MRDEEAVMGKVDGIVYHIASHLKNNRLKSINIVKFFEQSHNLALRLLKLSDLSLQMSAGPYCIIPHFLHFLSYSIYGYTLLHLNSITSRLYEFKSL